MTLFTEIFETKRRIRDSEHARALSTLQNLIRLYEAWNKPEKVREWRAKLTQIEDFKK